MHANCIRRARLTVARDGVPRLECLLCWFQYSEPIQVRIIGGFPSVNFQFAEGVLKRRLGSVVLTMAIGRQAEKQLVQTLRGDLNLISNEARRRYPAVREVSKHELETPAASPPRVAKVSCIGLYHMC